MNRDKLFDLFDHIGDSEINEAMSTDNAEKLHKLKRQSHRFSLSAITRYAAIAACFIFIIAISAALPNILSQRSDTGRTPNTDTQIASPIVTVDSVVEMEKYLQFNMPVSATYTPKAYTIYRCDNSYNLGEITYSNGISFKKAKDTNNVSGIYGGKVITSYEKDGVTVTLSSYGSNLYTEWNENGYSYCILGSETDSSIVEAMTDEMIGMENNN